MQDEELRDQLADWARSADRLPVPDIAGLRGRVRRHRLRAAAGVIAGLAVAAAVTMVVATLPDGPPVPPITAPVAWYPAGPLPAADAGPAAAPYFIWLQLQGPSQVLPDGSVAVTDWETGKQLARVRPPTRGAAFVGVAAAGDDRTFVLEADGRDSKPTAFYELRLRPDGRPLSLTRLGVPAATMAAARTAASPNPLIDPVLTAGVPGKGLNNSFAISPDGRKLAVAVAVGGRAAVDVVSLATGTVREWSAVGGNLQAPDMQLGWAGNHYVAFTWWVKGKVGPDLRLLDTSSGSNLLASRVVVGSFKDLDGIGASWLWNYYTVSPDGSTLFATYVGPVKVAIVQFSVRTGRMVREVLPSVRHGIRGPLCQVLWSDPSGRRVAAACGSDGDLEQGIVSDGKLRALSLNLPGNNHAINYWPGDFVAW